MKRFIALALGVMAGVASAGAEEEVSRQQALELHRAALLVDGHNDVTSFILDYDFDLGMDGRGPRRWTPMFYWIPFLRGFVEDVPPEELWMDTDLRRLQMGGVDAQFFSIFVDSRFAVTERGQSGRARDRALAMMQALMKQTIKHEGVLVLAETAEDVRRIAGEGKIAALMGLEGGHAIEDDLENLRMFHELGIRYMTLTWNNANGWADSCYEEPHGGLTDFGRDVVREMNRLGMLVDISHVSDATFWDVMETAQAPIIASHSSARALVDFARNMSDEMLRAVSQNGGVVMVSLQEPFIDSEKNSFWGIAGHLIRNLGWKRTSLERAVDHIEHVARVAGIDHVGLGSDFAGGNVMPEGLEDVSQFPNITHSLLQRGYGEAEIRKILGENTLRVLSEAALQASADPATGR